ncbi:MAG: hypothetical protein LBD21_02740 [Tannerellaceae bacterium]|jgi:hypothetical protein|nr:hypothetical protein [Tannerellaceae bacterium]
MKILLDYFEHQIDEKILKRGLDYFVNGCVTDVNELGDGNYAITVEGSDTYTVNLSIDENTVAEFECDCPYDMGPVCKHVAAALFYLQQEELATIALPAKKAKRRQKQKSVAEQAKELLGILPHDALRAFIRDTCASDGKFRQLFVAKHINYLYCESKDLYTKQLQALIKTYSHKHGFVDYRDAKSLGGIVGEMAAEAMAILGKGEVRKPMFIALAIIEEMSDPLTYCADDSGGHIGGCIEQAFAVLDVLAESTLSGAEHDELFDCLLGLSEKKSLKDWDWYFRTIGLAIKLLKTEEEKGRIKEALNKTKSDGTSWDWNYRNAQELMLELIKKTESREAAALFVENNISNPQFRAELIEQALKEKDYPKAERLAYEGITKDEKDAPGLADNWRNYLLTLYLQKGDTLHTIQFARYFMVYSNGHHHPLRYYYDLLKSFIDTEQWADYLENLIDAIKNKSRWSDYDRIAHLYIWEAQWDKLFVLLRQHVSFERIAGAEQYLAELYPQELATLYQDLILSLMERNMGRNHYQDACRYIRRMQKLGAKAMAADLVENLRNTYKNRRALIEELNNI